MRVRPTRLAVAATALAVTLATPLFAAPDAVAAPTFGNPFLADLVGDRTPDRVALGGNAKGGCFVSVAAGLGKGAYAAATTVRLPLQLTADDTRSCPDLAVGLAAPTRAGRQLAVTWTGVSAFGPSENVQVFDGFDQPPVTHFAVARYTGGFQGVSQPYHLQTRDFDGDGFGDLWEDTDQEPNQYWVGHDHAWHLLFRQSDGALSETPQFFDLNHNGTDILTVADNGSGSDTASAVDGRTGAVQVLGAPGTDPNVGVRYVLSVIDVDHDAYPDLLLTTTTYAATTTVTSTRFLNRSQGGHWYFQPLPAA